MSWQTYAMLYGSLWDDGPGVVAAAVPHLLPGVDLDEWRRLARHDYDWIDMLYIDAETKGA